MDLDRNMTITNESQKISNVYDIRFKDRLYLSFPKSYLIDDSGCYTFYDACIVIYLYYPDSLKIFRNYIRNAINMCDVCIITSNRELCKDAQDEYSEFNNVQVRLKQNRGRDVAALLVTAKDIFDNFKYICFVHDKKEKAFVWKGYTDAWTLSLWECSIGSEKYIENIIHYFRLHDEVGLLVPPEMIDMKNTGWYVNNWACNFDLTRKLADDIGLIADIDKTKPPISLGTVFWCKSVALKKLWNIDWKYESFNEEPLSDDGTISHAVERIFPYVAQDAGYKTATVMTEEETARVLSYAQLGMHSFYKILSEELGVEHIDDALKYQTRVEKLREYYKEHKEIYIYGNGSVSKRFLKLIRHLNIPVAGIIVSDKKENKREDGLDIYSISEICHHIINEKCGVVIGVSDLYMAEITDTLQNYYIKNYLVL
jgi:rhamnosyltransferase